jgi:Asp-tRNA(Asn)/Glu-tRNA(Gln) amidotransferase C subunit
MEGRRERKVVTVLFADLVGFTARAEQLDPEDVEAILRPYHGKLGLRADEAQARLRAAQDLVAKGNRVAADEQLTRALGLFRSVGASRYVREGEALLAAST